MLAILQIHFFGGRISLQSTSSWAVQARMSLLMGRHLPHFQPSLRQHFDFVFSLPSLVGELRLYRLPWLYTWLMSCRLKPFCNLVRVILEQNKCSSTLLCWLALVAQNPWVCIRGGLILQPVSELSDVMMTSGFFNCILWIGKLFIRSLPPR